MKLYEEADELLTSSGKLSGIGSLALGIRADSREIEAGNLFIPVDLVMPHLDYMKEHGQKPGKLRPWLGALALPGGRELGGASAHLRFSGGAFHAMLGGRLRLKGVLVVDGGAADALAKGGSLLAKGVTAVEGAFVRGDAIAGLW